MNMLLQIKSSMISTSGAINHTIGLIADRLVKKIAVGPSEPPIIPIAEEPAYFVGIPATAETIYDSARGMIKMYDTSMTIAIILPMNKIRFRIQYLLPNI